MYSWSVCLRECGSDRTDTGPELTDPVRILCMVPGGAARLIEVDELIWVLLSLGHGTCRRVSLNGPSC